MRSTTLECRNCGADLNVEVGARFMECEFCKTAHRVESDSSGAPSLTMLEATVTKIDDTTTKPLDIHKTMAANENARVQLQQFNERSEKELAEINDRGERLVAQLASVPRAGETKNWPEARREDENGGREPPHAPW